MLCSFELPDKKPKLDEGIRHAWLIVLLLVIIGLAIYFAVSFQEVALMLLESIELSGF